MKLPHIRACDVVKNGIVVTYDDSTSAFYHESVLHAHLLDASSSQPAAKKKEPRHVSLDGLREDLTTGTR